MSRLRRGRLIKRFDLPAVYRKNVMSTDPDNYFDNDVASYEQIQFHVIGCTIQPVKDWVFDNVLQVQREFAGGIYYQRCKEKWL